MVRLVRPLALVVATVLAACNSPADPPAATKSAAPKAAASGPAAGGSRDPSAAPSGTPRPGPTGFVTNRPSVSVSAGATVAPAETPAPAATFGAIAAGLLNDGDGRDPKTTPLASVGDLELDADGTLWIAARERLYKLPVGGALTLVGGGHRTNDQELDGKPITAAGFGAEPPLTVHPDSTGAPLLAYGHVLARQAADGKLDELWRGDADDVVAGIVPLADGKFALMVRSGGSAAGSGRYAWWSARPGASSIRLRAASEAEAAVMRDGQGEAYPESVFQGPLGAAQSGKLWVRSLAGGRVTELDPAGAAPRVIGSSAFRPTHLDGRGKAYAYDQATGKLSTVTASSGTPTLVGSLPAGFSLAVVTGGPGGVAYAAGRTKLDSDYSCRVYKLAGGGTELVAGVAAPMLGEALDTPLRPTGLVALTAGELLAADALRGQILRVRAGKPVEALYGKPGGASPADGADAAKAALSPRALTRDAEGRLSFLNGLQEAWRIDAAGRLARLYAEPTSGDAGLVGQLTHLAGTPDGDVLVAAERGISGGQLVGHLIHVDALGVAKPVPLTPGTERIAGMATDSAGAIVFGLATPGVGGDDAWAVRLMRWTLADGVKEAASGTWRHHPAGFGVLGVDAKNRWYMLAGTGPGGIATLTRFDPADGTRALIAGPGAPRFAGDTTDDSLSGGLGFALLGSEGFLADAAQIKHLSNLAD